MKNICVCFWGAWSPVELIMWISEHFFTACVQECVLYSSLWYITHTLHIVFLSQKVVLPLIVLQRGDVRRGFVFNDLTSLCSVAPALCGPARQLSSPAPPAASADWPELQQRSPGEGESETLYSTNTLNVQEYILVTLVQKHISNSRRFTLHTNGADTTGPYTHCKATKQHDSLHISACIVFYIFYR